MVKKRGQVTLFIVLAIIIVAVALVYFLYVGPKIESDSDGRLNFEKCVKDVAKESSEKLGETGGYIKPDFIYTYRGERIPYLCYTNEYYKTCTIQEPFLKQHFETQLKKFTEEKINLCYENSLDALRARGYSVQAGKLNYSVSLEPGVIKINIQSPTTIGSNKFSKFNVAVVSPVYEMLMISTTILQFETRFGGSDVDSITMLYPDYYIDKIKRDDGTTVYFLENKIFGNKFKFATRSLVFPAGYG
ncbi:MAG: hypothetical protein Q8N88_03965 [Nanoarchaeota archaeon]|nr:hypothetical protein [Nanoarchaeota archaeon]